MADLLSINNQIGEAVSALLRAADGWSKEGFILKALASAKRALLLAGAGHDSARAYAACAMLYARAELWNEARSDWRAAAAAWRECSQHEDARRAEAMAAACDEHRPPDD
jgi:hypothetical protein